MTKYAIRVVLPYHLQTLAQIGHEVAIEVEEPVTYDSIIDAIECRFPKLRGTIRDHATRRRRALLRYFVCEKDVSHDPPDTLVPDPILTGDQPFIVWGAIAGG